MFKLVYFFLLITIIACQEADTCDCQDLIERQEYRKAISCMNKRPIYKDDLYEYFSRIGLCYHSLKLYDSAIYEYRLALKVIPNDLYCLMNLGDVYFKQGNFLLAKQMFQSVSKIDINYPNVNFNLGVIYYNENEYDSAVFFLNKEIKTNPNCASCFFLKGQIFSLGGKEVEAIEVLKQGLLLEDNFDALMELGTIYFRLHDYNKSIEFHTQALSVDSSNSLAYVKRSAAFGLLGLYEKVIEDCTDALRLDSLCIDALISRKTAYRLLKRNIEYKKDSLSVLRLMKKQKE